MFSWRITSVDFVNGKRLQTEAAHLLDTGSVQLIVGANRSGKSTLLSELEPAFAEPLNPPPGQHVHDPAGAAAKAARRVIVRDAAAAVGGTLEDLLGWLTQGFPTRLVTVSEQGPSGDFVVQTMRGSFRGSQLRALWPQVARKPLLPLLMHLLDTGNRLRVGDYAESIPAQAQPRAYIHMLQASRSLELRVREEVKEAFGDDLLINWSGGQSVGFHLGDEPSVEGGHDRVSPEYAEALRSLPRLEESGDGIRSFVGCVLAALCGTQPVLLVDEPEAFLHPGQAYRLGALLAKTAKAHRRQVFVATHSSDVVRGVVASNEHTAIWRLTRAGDHSDVFALDAAKLREIVSRPYVASSDVIAGLFHNAVIVCESDSDSMFYETIANLLGGERRVASRDDVRWVKGNGKGQLAALALAYRALEIRTAVLADIDLLRNEQELRAVVEALGGDFGAIEAQYKAMRIELGTTKAAKAVESVTQGLRELADEFEAAGSMNQDGMRRLRALVSEAGDWSDAKRYGLDKLQGEPRKSAEELLAAWREIGLFIVPVGELERWWRNGPSDKAKWLQAALGELRANVDVMPGAVSFVRSLFEYLEIRDL
jgi:predicted ATPase